MNSSNPLLAPVKGAESRTVGGVQVDVVRAGAGRVKRVIYPPGFRWSTHLKPAIGTEWCQHAHVGFLVSGRIHVEFSDGCVEEFTAPQGFAVAAGHDGWVVGDEHAVMIEFDFEGDTAERFGVAAHRHENV